MRICDSCEQAIKYAGTEFEGHVFCHAWCALDWVENGRQTIRERRKQIEELKQ